MMTSPTMGWSLSAPVHVVHIFGLPCSSFGSARPVILPKSLPPCSYISTWDLTLPLFSSTVFHVPVSASLARSVPTPNSMTTSTAVTSVFIDPPSRRIREIRAASCAKRWEGGYGTLGQYRLEEVHPLMGRRFLTRGRVDDMPRLQTMVLLLSGVVLAAVAAGGAHYENPPHKNATVRLPAERDKVRRYPVPVPCVP